MRTRIRQLSPLPLLFVLALASCDGGEDFSPTTPTGGTGPPPGAEPPPSNATAAGAVTRLIWAIEQQDEDVYEDLLTGDFRFDFSESADSALSEEYPDGWTRADESGAVTNLFRGGENEEGVVQPEATSIQVDFGQVEPEPASGAQGGGATESVLSTPIAMTIQTIATPENPRGQRYTISDEAGFVYHRIELVRGDVAVGLTSDQPADELHWYLSRWVGQEPLFGSPNGGSPTAPNGDDESLTTWGRLKSLYR